MYAMTSSNLPSSLQPNKQVARFATVAIASIGYFIVIVVSLHFLRPDYDPLRQAIAEYAVGPFGLLMTSALVAQSIGSLALLAGLYQAVSSSMGSRIALGLLGIFGMGALIAGMFPLDLQGAPQTIQGTIHMLTGFLAFPSLVFAAVLLSWHFRHDPLWQSFHGPALILSLTMLLGFLAVPLVRAMTPEIFGLGQRIFMGISMTWMLLTAAHLRSVAFVPVSA